MVVPHSLVVAHQGDQGLAGAVDAGLGGFLELVPGENDVVAVHDQVFLGRLRFGGRGLRSGGLSGREDGAAADRPVGALKDGHQLLVLFEGVVGLGRLGRSGWRGLVRGRFPAKAGPHVHVGGRLPPGHHHARPVGAEHGVCRVFNVPLRVVADGRHNGVLPGAGLVAPRPEDRPAQPVGVGGHVPGVMPRSADGGLAGHQRDAAV